jgi:uncharacterized membrane protein YkgB
MPVVGTMAVIAPKLEAAGHALVRSGLVLILVWIGAMKFTAHEAAGIQPLVASSPFMGWMYSLLSLQAVSNLLGVTEISIALMIALRPLSPTLAAIGSAAAALMFLTTLSFLFSLPGWEPSLGGFPALSSVGGFLLKDICLLGAALWSLGEAVAALKSIEPKMHALRTKSAFGS